MQSPTRLWLRRRAMSATSLSARLFRVRRVLSIGMRRALRESPEGNTSSSSQGSLPSLTELVKFGMLATCVHNYLLCSMQCVGPSMLPTIGASGDVVLMWPTASGLIKPRVGDIVIATSPTDPAATVCKRVTGLSGDEVHYQRLAGMPGTGTRAIVPRGQCWLLGDNASDSTDSRYYGPVPIGLIRGIVFLKVWPLSEFGWLPRVPPPPPRREPPSPRWEPPTPTQKPQQPPPPTSPPQQQHHHEEGGVRVQRVQQLHPDDGVGEQAAPREMRPTPPTMPPQAPPQGASSPPAPSVHARDESRVTVSSNPAEGTPDCAPAPVRTQRH